jgi:hypothetical protein
MGFLLSVAVAILSFSSKQIGISGFGRESQTAFYAADSGVECVRFNDDQGNIYQGIREIECHGVIYRITSISEVACPADEDCADNANPNSRYTKYIFAPAKLVSGNSNDVPEIEIVLIKQEGDEGLSTLTSRGRNTTVASGDARVERALKVTYKPKKCFEEADIFLVVDGSGSILADQIPDLKRNLKDFSRRLLNTNGNKVGLIVFRGLAHVPVRLTDNYEELATAIDSIRIASDTNRGTGVDSWDTYMPSDDDTNIPLGLRYALNEFNDQYDTNELDRTITVTSYAAEDKLNRPNSKDIVILFTDGAPDSIIDDNNEFYHEKAHNSAADLGVTGPLASVIAEATRLKEDGNNGPVEVFAVGIAGSDYRRCDDDWNSPINQCVEGVDSMCWKDPARMNANQSNSYNFNESCARFMSSVLVHRAIFTTTKQLILVMDLML